MSGTGTIELKRWLEVMRSEDLVAGIDAIFFAASATQHFESASVRDAFRERWLGRYLEHYPEWFYVAVSSGQAVGYLAGCLEDPALSPRFSDIAFFETFADLTPAYPAHLHINLDASYRNAGLGGRLIDLFVADAEAAGVAGIHVVTGYRSRNRTFYLRNGFEVLRELPDVDPALVFLGRRLSVQTECS